jgi:heat shock protein HtpX
MIGVWAVVTAVATLVVLAVLTWFQIPFFGIYGILGFVVFFHVLQWLMGPRLIEAVYHVRPLKPHEYPWLHTTFSGLTTASGFKGSPKLMLAEIDLPNAFAYGNPLTGSSVAVTRGLLENLPKKEVEAVVGHELGHLRHRDVTLMLMISIIPALIYYLGYVMYISGWFGGGAREGRGGSAYLPLIGIALIVLSFIFNLFVFYFSRLREYYADSHAARIVGDGARNLQRALVRIMNVTGRLSRSRRTEQARKFDEFKMFFITDPDKSIEGFGDVDSLVERVKASRPSIAAELFSTHPHPAKRLRHLDKFI